MVTRPYYLLYEAFERLGNHLYGTEWTPNVITAVRTKSPEETEAGIARFRKTIAAIDARQEQLEAEWTGLLTAERTAEIENERNALAAARLKVVEPHPDFWRPGWAEDRMSAAQNYQRKTITETTLIEAIKAGKFRVESLRQMLDPWVWKDRVVYHNIELSLVLGPPSWGDKSQRFQLVRIREDGFEAWLGTVKPLYQLPEAQRSPEERCEEFLRREVASGVKRMPVDAYYAEAAKLFPGLGRRAFDRIWARVVPDSWTKAGAPKKENRRTRAN